MFKTKFAVIAATAVLTFSGIFVATAAAQNDEISHPSYGGGFCVTAHNADQPKFAAKRGNCSDDENLPPVIETPPVIELPEELPAVEKLSLTCTNTTAQTIKFGWKPLPNVKNYRAAAHLDGQPNNIAVEVLPADAESWFSSTVTATGLIGSQLDLLNSFDETFTVTITAIYENGESDAVAFPEVHAKAGLLGLSKKITCAA